MGVCVQLVQIAGETLVEVSGGSTMNGIYLENEQVDISVDWDADEKKIKLTIAAQDHTIAPVAFALSVAAYRIVLDRLLNGASLVIVPDGIDEDLCDAAAVKSFLQNSGGIWLDGLPREIIQEMLQYYLC